MAYIFVGARFLLAAVFLLAAAGKLRSRKDFESFSRSLADLRILPRTVRWVAVALPACEVALALLLAIDRRTAVVGLLASAALLIVFNVGIAVAIRQGTQASCRCFGASSGQLGPMQILRNFLLVLVAGAGVAGAADAGPVTILGFVLAAVSGAVLGFVLTILDDLPELFSPATGTRK